MRIDVVPDVGFGSFAENRLVHAGPFYAVVEVVRESRADPPIVNWTRVRSCIATPPPMPASLTSVLGDQMIRAEVGMAAERGQTSAREWS